MTNTEFKTKLTEAFKTHMFMKDRDYHTVNELLYVLIYHLNFKDMDFNISIHTLDNRWLSIPTLEAFVDIHTRGIWFNDADIEFEVEDDSFEDCLIVSNCITIYERENERVNNMNGVYVATMESENYTWTAVGLTKDEAIETITKEWNEGLSNEYRDKMTSKELDNYYGISYEFIEFGKCNWR